VLVCDTKRLWIRAASASKKKAVVDDDDDSDEYDDFGRKKKKFRAKAPKPFVFPVVTRVSACCAWLFDVRVCVAVQMQHV
jgi:hypothetical protein